MNSSSKTLADRHFSEKHPGSKQRGREGTEIYQEGFVHPPTLIPDPLFGDQELSLIGSCVTFWGAQLPCEQGVHLLNCTSRQPLILAGHMGHQ